MTKRRVLFALALVALLLFGVVAYEHFYGRSEKVSSGSSISRVDASVSADVKKKGTYPDPSLTPGVIDPTETKEALCVPNHTKNMRHVTLAMKKEVFRRYGLSYDEREEGALEVDHFIPLVLGGANVVENLWPEPALPRPGFHEKDIVEVYLHHRVCHGEISLAEAQEAIRKDWYAAYEEWCAKRKNKRKPCVVAQKNEERIQ